MTAQHFRFTTAFGGDSFNDAAALKYKYRPLPRQQYRFHSHQHLHVYPPSSLPPPSYLALMTTGQQVYSYNLTPLEYHTQEAPAHETEPFWHQYDQVQQFALPPHRYPTYGYTHYNFVYDPFSMQDFAPVFIGSNTANGKILNGRQPQKPNQPRKPNQTRKNPLLKPFGSAQLFCDNGLIDLVQVKDLTRFSRSVGTEFSRARNEGNEEGHEASSGEDLGFNVEIGRTEDGFRKINLANSRSEIWVSPPSWAFQEVLHWMVSVRGFSREERLPDFTVEAIEEWGLDELVNVYTATLILGLRPRAAASSFRSHIITELYRYHTTAKDFQYVHEHLPVSDIVLKKMIEFYLIHGERGGYKHESLRGEEVAIQQYVNSCRHEEFKRLAVETQRKRDEAKLMERTARANGQTKKKGKGKQKATEAGAKGPGKKEAVQFPAPKAANQPPTAAAPAPKKAVEEE